MNTPINDGGPAFPVIESRNSGGTAYIQDSTARIVTYGGMTLRDYLAARAPAMPASFQRLSEKWDTKAVNVPKPDCPEWHEMRRVPTWHEDDTAYLCRWNYCYADAMLTAREAKP